MFFENSFSLALIVFAFWQGLEQQWLFSDSPPWAMGLLIVLDLALLVHSALFILPIYALVQPLGSLRPEEVLRKARKMDSRKERAAPQVNTEIFVSCI